MLDNIKCTDFQRSTNISSFIFKSVYEQYFILTETLIDSCSMHRLIEEMIFDNLIFYNIFESFIN